MTRQVKPITDALRQALADVTGYMETTARQITGRGVFDDLLRRRLVQVDSFGRVHLTRDGRHALKKVSG